MITKNDSKNAIWLAYCDLRADYEQVEQELDSAKISYEQMHKIYRGAEDECDQLKVEVEALKPYRDNHHNLMRHMAEHDAQVIEKFLTQEAPRIDPDIPIPLEDQHCCENTLYQERERIHAAANQLLQKAQENPE